MFQGTLYFKPMQNNFYLQNICTLSDKQKIVTHRPITTLKGIKLVDSGVSISRVLYDKLMQHHLLPEIDECLQIEKAVTSVDISEGVRGLLDGKNFKHLLSGDTTRQRVLEVFLQLRLNPVIAFKLTVIREQMPDVFRHSLEVALCAVVLAMSIAGSSEKEIIEAAGAGLLHDVGLVHLEPRILHTHDPLSEAEHHHIYSHPVLGHVMLSRFPEWHPVVSTAVLEHHERLDASGYPRGLGDSEISQLGQLLAVAELTATLFARKHVVPLGDYMHVILRLNQGKFNRDLVNTLTSLAMQPAAQEIHGDRSEISFSEILDNLVFLSMAIQNWTTCARHFGPLKVVDLINHRIEHLEKNLAGIGIDLQYWGMVDAELAEDHGALLELSAGVSEGRWQLQAIAKEVKRKWDKIRPENTSVQEEIWGWLKQVDEVPRLPLGGFEPGIKASG